MLIQMMTKMFPELRTLLGSIHDFTKKHWFKAFLAFVLFTVMKSYLVDSVDLHFKYEAAKANQLQAALIEKKQRAQKLQDLIRKISGLSADIASQAIDANHTADTLSFFVCKKVYNKAYSGVPCYRYAPTNSIAAKVGGFVIQNLHSQDIAYDTSLSNLETLLSNEQDTYPSLKVPNYYFQRWVDKTRSNCWFPVSAYRKWGQVFKRALKHKKYNSLIISGIISKEVEFAHGGYPQNCSNYSNEETISHVGSVNHITE